MRFDTSKKPKFGIFDKNLALTILIGKEQKKAKIKVDIGVKEGGFKPSVEITEEFITITKKNDDKISWSVHDFLEWSGINIGLPKKVEYVGYTKEPEVRPTKGEHGGLSDILHRVSNEDNDIFITFNLFKVMSLATGSPSMINFMVPNSMTDEISVDLEGRILEKCFILYFNSDNQWRNKSNERAELVNNLRRLSQENKIRAIHVCYEPDGPSEYFMLYSSQVKAKSRHVFVARLNGEALDISTNSEYFSDEGFNFNG